MVDATLTLYMKESDYPDLGTKHRISCGKSRSTYTIGRGGPVDLVSSAPSALPMPALRSLLLTQEHAS